MLGRRLITLLTLAVMSLLVLVACTQPATTATPTTGAAAPTTAAPAPTTAAPAPTTAAPAATTVAPAPTAAMPAGTPSAMAPALTQEYRLSFATGGTGGTYYPFGGAVANVIGQNLEGVSVNVEATGGSVENIRLLASGEAEMAWVQNDITHYAVNGEEMFEGDAVPVAGLLASYTELVQIAVAADAGITSVEDLAGKNVAVGAPGSGTEVNARQVLDAAGLSFEDLGEVFNLSFAEAAAHFRDRQIDAFFVTGGVPNASIQEAALARPLMILPVEGEVLSAIEGQYPFLVSDTIPANTYQGQTSDVTTVGVVAIIAVSEEMEDALAYNLAKTIVENRAQIAQAHAKGSSIQPEQITRGITVPLHPGAEQYYRDAGIMN